VPLRGQVEPVRFRSSGGGLARDPSARSYAQLAHEHALLQDIETALRVALEGLRTHPGDAELKRVSGLYRQLTLTAAFSVTGSGNNILNPWGTYPGYLSMIELSFNRAREAAALVGAAYDFSQVLTPGLSGNVNLVWGWNAINPTTRKNAPNQAEYDATVDYRPPFKVPVLQGMWVRFRSAIIDQHDAKTLGYQFRIIINWDRDLI
jgi:hypothetical protein